MAQATEITTKSNIMTTEQIIQKLINGETVSITNKVTRKEIQKRLREIKENCAIVLSQLKDKNF